MGFFDNVEDSLGGAIGSAVGGVPGMVMGNVFGGMAAKQGAGINNRYSAEYEQTMYDRARERGLTPQEYYGSPAPGASPSGSAQQTMGNQMQAMASKTADAAFQANQAQKERDNKVEIAKIQTGSQELIADKALQEKVRQFNLSVKPKISRELKILDNTIATGDPIFIEKLKKLSMGTENMFVELVTRAYGLKSFDDFNKLTKEEQHELMSAMLAGGSTYRKELAGLYAHAEGLGLPTSIPSFAEFVEMANEAGKAIRSILKSLGLSGESDSTTSSSSPAGRPTLGSSHEPQSQPGNPFKPSGWRN